MPGICLYGVANAHSLMIPVLVTVHSIAIRSMADLSEEIIHTGDQAFR
ncbi:hypothetical protein [uncultured Methanospirillum sp.]|nr:hypothetical protein [uncultured Methanospirillum sp.]